MNTTPPPFANIKALAERLGWKATPFGDRVLLTRWGRTGDYSAAEAWALLQKIAPRQAANIKP